MQAHAQVKPNGQTAGNTILYAQADLLNDEIVWCLDNKNPPKKNSKINLNFGKNAGAQQISVQLIDNTGRGLQFSSDPLWVSEGGTCPPPNGINSTQIQNVARAGTTLTFTDRNQGQACTLIYQMNFVDRNNNPVKPLDPEIQNGGTNVSMESNWTTVAVVTAVVALVAIVALTTLR